MAQKPDESFVHPSKRRRYRNITIHSVLKIYNFGNFVCQCRFRLISLKNPKIENSENILKNIY